MKKIIKSISFVLAGLLLVICLSLSFNNSTLKNANAANFAGATPTEFADTVTEILNDYVNFDERVAGSDDEKLAGDYIISKLDETKCEPLVNDNITDGEQKFTFQSIFDGIYYSSRNIIYNYNSKKATDKKVIIGCSYDSVAYKYNEYGEITSLVSSQGVNGSAGSVAVLLALAEYLPEFEFDFNIQFVFFGAGSSDNAGSRFFTQGIKDEELNNILLMINLDNIAVGRNLYFYIDEIENDFSKYVSDFSSKNQLDIKKVSVSNLGKLILTSPNELGFMYRHICLTSNNIQFMKRGILTMNIFAGDYSNGIVLGRSEYADQEVVTFTGNDNLEYITNAYGEDSITNNLYSVYDTLQMLLKDNKFEATCVSSVGQTEWVYKFFTGEKLPAFITLSATIILIGVALIIHFKLTKRAYYANIEKGFIKTVLDITSNISGKVEDEDIPKFISEIIVRDIKRDKKIKGKNNNKQN